MKKVKLIFFTKILNGKVLATNTQLTRFVARGLWVLLAMLTLSEDF